MHNFVYYLYTLEITNTYLDLHSLLEKGETFFRFRDDDGLKS